MAPVPTGNRVRADTPLSAIRAAGGGWTAATPTDIDRLAPLFAGFGSGAGRAPTRGHGQARRRRGPEDEADAGARPASQRPESQVTVPVPLQSPTDEIAAMTVAPEGTESVTVTPGAMSGPTFVTVVVKVACPPAGSGPAVSAVSGGLEVGAELGRAHVTARAEGSAVAAAGRHRRGRRGWRHRWRATRRRAPSCPWGRRCPPGHRAGDRRRRAGAGARAELEVLAQWGDHGPRGERAALGPGGPAAVYRDRVLDHRDAVRGHGEIAAGPAEVPDVTVARQGDVRERARRASRPPPKETPHRSVQSARLAANVLLVALMSVFGYP